MPLSFQDMIARLQAYWAERGCVVMQPYHTEVGAGTFNPATVLRCLGPEPWKTFYVEPSIRPGDGPGTDDPATPCVGATGFGSWVSGSPWVGWAVDMATSVGPGPTA